MECGQEEVASSIMNSTDPVIIKRLGDKVKVNHNWSQHQLLVMKTGCTAKFNQNEHLKEMLLRTGSKDLVHAGMDRFWGAGVGLGSPNLITKSWPGQNKLGDILMSVREALTS